MTPDGDTKSHKEIETVPTRHGNMSSLLDRFGKLFNTMPKGELVKPTAEPISLQANGRIAWDGRPFKLTLGMWPLRSTPILPSPAMKERASAIGSFMRAVRTTQAFQGSSESVQGTLFFWDEPTTYRKGYSDSMNRWPSAMSGLLTTGAG